jgi:hypothetical protein
LSDSQTVKKTVMLAGRVPAELKKRYDAARKRHGWNSQTALERVVSQWLEMEEKKGPGAASAHELQRIVLGPSDPTHTVVREKKSQTPRGGRE